MCFMCRSIFMWSVGPSDSVRAEESLILKGIDLEYENDGQSQPACITGLTISDSRGQRQVVAILITSGKGVQCIT